MKRVVVFGTFDLLHPGHLWFLEHAKRHGDELVVVVSRDARVAREKGQPFFDETERLRMVRSLACVSRAVLGEAPGSWTALQKLKPAVICLGYDQEIGLPVLQAQLRKLHRRPRIIRITAKNPERYSSSKLRKNI